MKIKVLSVYQIIYIVFVALFPVLPDYFRLFSYPIYQYMVLLMTIVLLLRGLSKQRLYFYLKFMGIPLILAIISYGWYGEISTIVSYVLLPFLSSLVVFCFVDNLEMYNKSLKVIVITSIIICGMAVIEKFGFNVFSLVENVDMGSMGTEVNYRNSTARVEQSFGQPIMFALYLLFVNVIAFSQIKYYKIKKINNLYVIAYLLSIAISLLTDARLTLITLIILQAFYLIKSKISKKIIAIFLIFLVLFVDFIIGGYVCSIAQKYISLLVDLMGPSRQVQDMTSLYRLQLIPTLIPYIQKHFFIGYGKVYMSDFRFSMFGYNYSSIDNFILSSMMQHGILGLIVAYMPMFYGIYFSWRSIKRENNNGKFFLLTFVLYILNLISVAQLSERRIVFIFVALLMSREYNLMKESRFKSY